MKVFEYRAKPIDSVEWTYGQLLYNESRDEHFIIRKLGLSPLAIEVAKSCVRVKPDTICLRVGMTKDGEPVYEGDVVESRSWNEYFSRDGLTMEPFVRKFVVLFKEHKAVLKEIYNEGTFFVETAAFDVDDVSDLVVTGNIIDNPELAPISFREYVKNLESEKISKENGYQV